MDERWFKHIGECWLGIKIVNILAGLRKKMIGNFTNHSLVVTYVLDKRLRDLVQSIYQFI